MRSKGGNYILERVRPYRKDSEHVLKDEWEWANTPKRIQSMWSWYYYYGLQRATPHPMEKDLAELYDKYLVDFLKFHPESTEANPYRKVGTGQWGKYQESLGE